MAKPKVIRARIRHILSMRVVKEEWVAGGRETTTETRFHEFPISFLRPAAGKSQVSVTCQSCGNELKIRLRSRAVAARLGWALFVLGIALSVYVIFTFGATPHGTISGWQALMIFGALAAAIPAFVLLFAPLMTGMLSIDLLTSGSAHKLHYDRLEPVAAASLASVPTRQEVAVERPMFPHAGASPMRLADPAHRARMQLDQVATIADQVVQVETKGIRVSFPTGQKEKALSLLDEALALCPSDLDVFVAKADILYAAAQFKSAEVTLDAVLRRDPAHFEARMWKSHWNTWLTALRFPRWHERQTSLHPMMAAGLKLVNRVQLVRDGVQKALAIVAAIEGPPPDSRTQVKVEWVLSQTPVGPLVAYYLSMVEPSGEPNIMEAFLPILAPTSGSPMSPGSLVQQLAFAPYCFVVLVNGNNVLLNRRIGFGPKTTQKIRDIAASVAATKNYLPVEKAQGAMQWHMNNFDMGRLQFE